MSQPTNNDTFLQVQPLYGFIVELWVQARMLYVADYSRALGQSHCSLIRYRDYNLVSY